MIKTDVLIIGGGASGLSSAFVASNNGASVIIIESDSLGGVLNQCIHNGFEYGDATMTGTELACKLAQKLPKNVEVIKGTAVSVSSDRIVEVVTTSGVKEIKAHSVVLSSGATDVSVEMLQINGNPLGVYTAGEAQRLINRDGISIGKKAVVLGSGDVGMILARRLTLEGVKVEAIIERKQQPSANAENVARCTEDFNIPLITSSTVTQAKGAPRLNEITVVSVDEFYQPVPNTDKIIRCDTLIIACGRRPYVVFPNAKLDHITGGCLVNDRQETSQRGVFACGDAVKVGRGVREVIKEGEVAGKYASMRALTLKLADREAK